VDNHSSVIDEQFTRQAKDFASAPELHNDDVLSLMVKAGAPQPSDSMIDVACGPGSVVAAFAPFVQRAVGVDATAAMLAEANKLIQTKALGNVEFSSGNAYDLAFPSGSFQIVVSRFAFHHLEDPRRAFEEMVRIAAPGGRIVLCDAVALDDSGKAAALNHMERWRDPSTVEFRTLPFLQDLFSRAGLEAPALTRFQVPFVAHDFVKRSFPANDDHAGLLRLIEDSVDGDLLGLDARQDKDGVHIAFQAIILSAQTSLILH
jgi:ubiquinone/menaquinone biosynthesis C-methylase UbiE